MVTKETMTVEGMIKIVYDLLKDKLNIAKITFVSGVNTASAEFTTKNQIDRCPLCGIALNENGVCPKLEDIHIKITGGKIKQQQFKAGYRENFYLYLDLE